MRYTKYDFRKKNQNKVKVLFPFIIIIVLGVILGMIIFKLFFIGDNSIFKIFDSIKQSNMISEEEVVKTEFASIQCGVYEKKENADNALLKIPNDFSKFIVDDNGKYKVMAGIYSVNELDNKLSELKSDSIESFVVKYEINEDSFENKAKGEILKAYLQIITKVFNQEVKSVNTQEFKKWVLQVLNENEINEEETKSIIERINQLPEEYKKEKGEEDIIYLLHTLKNYEKDNY